MKDKKTHSEKSLCTAPLWVKLVVIIGSLAGFSSAFRIVDIEIPDKVLAGNRVVLKCDVDFGSQSLYSLTWWKDDRAFYKFSPSSAKQKVYKVKGISVDMESSSMEIVVLKNVSLETSGDFKCEMVAETPSFEKDFKNKTLTVVRTPDRPPLLSVERNSFLPGEVLHANCTSTGARPPPDIKWYINEVPISSTYTKVVSNELPYMGIFNRSSVLTLPLRDEHFMGGHAILSCSTFIEGVYDKREHRTVLLTGYGNVVPSQMFSGQGKASSALKNSTGFLVVALSVLKYILGTR